MPEIVGGSDSNQKGSIGLEEEVEQYEPSEEEKKLAGKISRLYDQKRYTKRAYEKTWFLTHAFLIGQQWIAYNDYTRQFITNVKVPSYRVRLVANKMIGKWNKRNTKILRSKPIVRLVPATHEDDDIARAKHQEKVLEAEARRVDLDEVDHEVVWWATKAGTSFYKIFWDPSQGPKIPMTEMGLQSNPEDPLAPDSLVETPVLDEFGNPEMISMGDVEVDVASPFEIDVDPRATRDRDLDWIMHSTIRPRSWIKKKFPEKGRFVPRERKQEDDYYERRMREIVGILGYSSEASTEGEYDSDTAVYREYYERPSLEHPNGRFVIMAGGIILNPLDDYYFDEKHWHPFVPVRDMTVVGRFWGMANAEQQVPLQKEYNKSRSQEIEDRNLCARPKVTCPNGANLKKTAFDSEPGELIFFNPQQGMRPEYMRRPMEHIAAYEATNRKSIMDMDDISGEHEVSRGRIPPGVESGVAIELLQEADEDQMESTINSFLRAKKELARRWLKLIGRYWTDPRLINVVGESEEPETFWFSKDQMEGNDPQANYYNVDIQTGSALSLSKSAKQSRLISLVKSGILDPVADKRMLLRYLDVGISENIYSEERLDENQARKNNRLMAAGQMVPVYPWQNQEIHLSEINRFRKHPLYEKLPPQSKAIFDMVAEARSRLIMQKMMALSGMGGGAPNGKPEKSSIEPEGEQPIRSSVGERMNDRQSEIQARSREQRTGETANARGD